MSTEELAEIGSIALEWTECETLVEHLLWQLAGMSAENGAHFTFNMQMKSRLDMLATLGRERLPEGAQLEKFNAIIGELQELNTKRNHIIHGSWGAWVTLAELARYFEPGRIVVPVAHKRTKPGKKDQIPQKVSAKELKGVPERIAQATEKLWKFASSAWPNPAL